MSDQEDSSSASKWEGEFPSDPPEPPGQVTPLRRPFLLGSGGEPAPAEGSGDPATDPDQEAEDAPGPETAGWAPEEAGPEDARTGPTASAGRPPEPPPPAEERYSNRYFVPEEEDDDEPFERPGVQKLGIVGGKGVGKSFLFQSMVYRTYSQVQAGAMSYFLRKTKLFYAVQREDKAKGMVLSEFVNKYSAWERLPQTTVTTQHWYRLRLHYRTGILGRRESAMDVEFFDGSGEGFFEAARAGGIRKLWRDGYLNARVMVFCLPLWAAFPGRLSPRDQRERKDLLLGFERVLDNYEKLRAEAEKTKQSAPVKSILALTMADDPRSALTRLKDQWLVPYMESPELYLEQLRSGSGIARYLMNARRISEALHRELRSSRNPRVSSIPQRLDFGGRPWLIPLSAVDGKFLDRVEAGRPSWKEEERPELPEPVPVHVELPLLVALCERHNALM